MLIGSTSFLSLIISDAIVLIEFMELVTCDSYKWAQAS